MAQDPQYLVWLDMEMTGLQPESDRIIELAMVVTDNQLETVAESPVWAVHQDDACLAAMDEWNRKTHARSGLVDRVRASGCGPAHPVPTRSSRFLRSISLPSVASSLRRFLPSPPPLHPFLPSPLCLRVFVVIPHSDTLPLPPPLRASVTPW